MGQFNDCIIIGNKIGKDGSLKIGEGLKNNTTLTTLDLGGLIS